LYSTYQKSDSASE